MSKRKVIRKARSHRFGVFVNDGHGTGVRSYSLPKVYGSAVRAQIAAEAKSLALIERVDMFVVRELRQGEK
jgi:hypothetical protein